MTDIEERQDMSNEMSVEEMLEHPRSRPLLIAQAQKVFGLQGVVYFPAFSQFRDVRDLALLIEAKTKNVFDYGRCVRTSKVGSIVYPNNVPTIMQSLLCAEEGRYDAIDLRALGLVEVVDGEEVPLATLEDVCPGSAKAPAKKRKAPAKKRAPSKRKTPLKRTVTDPPAIRLVTPTRDEDTAPTVAVDLQPLETAVGSIGMMLEEHKGSTGESLEALTKDVALLREGVVGLAAFLNTVNNNLKTVCAYLDPHAELEGPSESALTALASAIPEDSTIVEEDAPEEAPATKKRTRKKYKKATVVEKVAADEPAPTPAESSDTLDFTRAELKAMGIEELRDIAEKVGVPKARELPYKQSLVTRICRLAAIQ